MPNDSIDEALKEVYALAPNNRIGLDTIQIGETGKGAIYMVQDRVSHWLTLETGETVEFEPVPFRFTVPAIGENGIQDISLAIDNVDRRVTDFFEELGTILAPVPVIYRPYLSDDPSKPRMNPPLELALSDIKLNAFEMAGRATFTNIVNRKYLTEFYDRSRFAIS